LAPKISLVRNDFVSDLLDLSALAKGAWHKKEKKKWSFLGKRKDIEKFITQPIVD